MKNATELLNNMNDTRATYEEALLKLRRSCDHQEYFVDVAIPSVKKIGGSEYKCYQCGVVFSMDEIDVTELIKSRRTLYNAIQQIKIFCDVTNEDEEKILKELSLIDDVMHLVVLMIQDKTKQAKKFMDESI